MSQLTCLEGSLASYIGIYILLFVSWAHTTLCKIIGGVSLVM